VSFYSQGINQSATATGTDKCNAIINCHLLTGRIGKPGMGPFSITGQPNAMGGREVGGLANQLAAHMDYSPETVQRVGRFWQAPNMASEPGFKAVDLFDAIAEGKIKAVWIMATNPVVSLPQSARVREALDACDLVVVSDCVRDTDTNSYADVLLPATGWSEKDGTVTNSERTISRQRALFPPAGNARHDWQIICDVAKLMGFAEAFDYTSPRDIFVEHAALSDFENNGERAFNIGKLQTLSLADYNSFLPMQWPITDSNPKGTARLFTDLKFFTVNAKAKLIPIEAKLPKVSRSLKFPFILNTGRVRDQWHTMTRTGLSAKLLAHFDAPFAQLNPQSSRELAVEDGDLVEISSLNGSIVVPVRYDSGIRPGEVFVPIHWSDQFTSNAGVGKIISARVDSISGQPETKLEAVALKAVTMLCWISFCSIREIDVKSFDYWHKLPLKKGFRYLMAMKPSEVFNLKFWIQSEFPESDLIEFIDEDQHDHRIACFEKGKLAAIAYSAKSHRSLPAANWLNDILKSKQHSNSWQLLAGKALNQKDVGKLICSCYEVGENQIIDAVLAGCVDHEELGGILRCGTNCGSCIPELMQLVKQYQSSVVQICSVNQND